MSHSPRAAAPASGGIGPDAPPSLTIRKVRVRSRRRDRRHTQPQLGQLFLLMTAPAVSDLPTQNSGEPEMAARCYGQVFYSVSTGGASKSIEALRGAVCGSLQLRRLSCGGSAAMAAIVPSLATGGGSGGQQQASVSVHLPRRTVAGGHAVVPGNVSINTALPNPSLKRSANGRPPAPGRWYAVHFHRPGAGVLPLSPA